MGQNPFALAEAVHSGDEAGLCGCGCGLHRALVALGVPNVVLNFEL